MPHSTYLPERMSRSGGPERLPAGSQAAGLPANKPPPLYTLLQFSGNQGQRVSAPDHERFGHRPYHVACVTSTYS